MSLFVQMGVVGSLFAPVAFGRDDGDRPSLFDGGNQRIAIVRFIADVVGCIQALEQFRCRDAVVRVAAGEEQPQRVAQGVHSGMDFGCQATAAAADGLGFAPPLPPAAC